MNNPMVSIVIPCYNQGSFLHECLDSLKSQTIDAERMEIIVVDDGSGPDTKATLRRLQDQYSFQLVTQDNGGLSHARNTGVQQSRGQYILPLDADNYLSDDAIARLVSALQEAQHHDPLVMFVYQDKVLFGADETYVPHQPYNLYRLLTDNFADACSLIDRRVFQWGLAYNETMRRGYEDWEFHLRIGLYGFKGQRLAGKTFFYRRWGYSMVNSADQNKTQLLEKIRDELATLYLLPCQKAIKRQWAPGLSIVCSGYLADQTLTDAAVVHDVDPKRPFTHPSLLRGKYLLFWDAPPDLRIEDRAFAEKLVLTMELRPSLHAIFLQSEGQLVGRLLRGQFTFSELPTSQADIGWEQLDPIILAKTDVQVWDLHTQSLTHRQTMSQTPERRLSRSIKNFGKRHIAPRIGFDTAYELFYHSYRVFALSKRALRGRRMMVQPESSAGLEPGQAIDQAFRHATDILF